MEPVFDKNGRTVGWLKEAVVHTRDAQPVAFVNDGAVFSYRRAYLGRFDNGFFRDRTGAAVAFTKGAHGGPMLPMTEYPPYPPYPPYRPYPPIPPIPPFPTLTWSRHSWNDFLRGM